MHNARCTMQKLFFTSLDPARLKPVRPGAWSPEPEPSRNRIVIIGAGHNGLVAAFYLARAGYAADRARTPRAGGRRGGDGRDSSRASACRRSLTLSVRCEPDVAADSTRPPRARGDRASDHELLAWRRTGARSCCARDAVHGARHLGAVRLARRRAVTRVFLRAVTQGASLVAELAREVAAVDRRPGARRAVAPAEDRAPLPRARTRRRVPAPAHGADARRGSRGRLVRNRRPARGHGDARDFRHEPRSALGRHRGDAAARCGPQSCSAGRAVLRPRRHRPAHRGIAAAAAEAGAEIRTGAEVVPHRGGRHGRARGGALDR